ncbi:MAG: hypothetical protein KGI60_02375 [Patescibacteria group bacterium]|nr:hypothetical protein [Patescibacteria group bacterium]
MSRKEVADSLAEVRAEIFLREALGMTRTLEVDSYARIGYICCRFELSRTCVLAALRSGALSGEKDERGRWKVWTGDVSDFALKRNIERILKRERHVQDLATIRKKIGKRLKFVLKSRR